MKLRDALGDSAEKPLYIETIPKRGYRFIAPVSQEEPVQVRGAETPGPSAQAASVGSDMYPAQVAIRAKTDRRKRWSVVASAAMALLALSVLAYLHFRRAPKLTDNDTIVLADFANSTGDPVFDGTLKQGLAVQLEQSPFLSIVSDDRVQQTLKLMGQPADARLTPDTAREICERTAGAAVLNGSIAQIGTQYLLTLKAINCESGESLASAEAQASDKNHVLDALGKTASEMRKKLGESLSSVQKYATPLEEATTSSLEALKAFSAGREVLGKTGDAAAIPFFKSAVELDPKFAIAYGWLDVVYNDIGESSIAADYARKAYELRDRTSEAEKYFISSRFYKEVTGNMEKAEQTCQLWIQAYPRSEDPHDLLSGAIYPVTGQYEKGVQEGKEAVRLNPAFSISYALLVMNYIYLNRLDEAKGTYQQAIKRQLNNPLFRLPLYQIAFLQNDTGAMAQQVAQTAGTPEVEDELLQSEADTAAYSGKLKIAREMSQRAMESAGGAQQRESSATYSAVSGLREALFGNAKEAQRRATLALARSTGRDVEYGSALALVYAGDYKRAHALTDDLGKTYPEDTIVQYNYLPTLRARLAISKGNFSEAIESLSAAIPFELGQSTFSSYIWTALYPIFVRGEAYLDAHQGSQAAAEFQKIIAHRGIVLNEPIGALAYLGLARAYATSGDEAKAKTAYQDFLTLWKDGDPDIPVLKQAKAEYVALR